jgi:methylmalonyl-CoA/ethylmalonyl-CoA epimerase
VDNLEEAKRFLGEVLGLTLDRELDLPERGLKAAFYRCGEADIEVIEVTDPEARKQRLPDGAKARIEHIAIQVDDLHKTLAALSAFGIRTTTAEPVMVGANKNVWTQPDTCDGVQYQFIEKG